MLNLDYKCMEYGQKIGKQGDEDILRKSLGVLQEDGVYAMFLWIEDKDKEKNIRNILTKLLNEQEIKKFLLGDSNSFEQEFTELCNNLKGVANDIDKLLFMKKILERTLTYALYHAKIGECNVEKS